MQGSVPVPTLVCGDRQLAFRGAAIMGVINVTPDSFSDGGQLRNARTTKLDKVLRRAQRMCAEGALFLDVGGESTRPGAAPVSEQEELDRVVPVIEALRTRFDAVLSVDTSSPGVMQAATSAGVGLINDVRALRRPGALDVVAASGVGICLMHMSDEPDVMQQNPDYENVVASVGAFLAERVNACEQAGISRNRIMIDPGFGFGKTLQHNLRLFAALPTLCRLGLPVLVGVSRKSMIGAVTGRPARGRVAGGLALATLADQAGAAVIRTHDVAATRDALMMYRAVVDESSEQ